MMAAVPYTFFHFTAFSKKFMCFVVTLCFIGTKSSGKGNDTRSYLFIYKWKSNNYFNFTSYFPLYSDTPKGNPGLPIAFRAHLTCVHSDSVSPSALSSWLNMVVAAAPCCVEGLLEQRQASWLELTIAWMQLSAGPFWKKIYKGLQRSYN